MWLQRDGGPELKLEPLEKDLYTLARVPSARIEFVRDPEGRIAAMWVLNRAAEWETSVKQR